MSKANNFDTLSSFGSSLNISISDVQFSATQLLRTTLGSCIAVVLYADPVVSKSKISSMSHFLLPEEVAGTDKTRKPFKFGSNLIPYQIQKMREYGIPQRHLLAKIAGGSMMFPNKEKTVLPDIGKQNARIARKILNEKNIRIIAEDTGGTIGRNIEFSPTSQKLRVIVFGKDAKFI